LSSDAPKTEAPAGAIDFATFILSLSTAALQNLGVGPDPGGKSEPAVNLPLAKQTIDLLALLKDKTQGNLTADEEKLIGAILYDLRMRFVEATRSSSTPA
jgi:hypothetical protein